MKKRLTGLLLLLLAFGTDVPAYAQGVEWETLTSEAVSLDQQGYHDRAILVAKKALQIAEQTAAPNQSSVAESLDNLAKLYYTHGQYALAEPLYERSLAITENKWGPDFDLVASRSVPLAGVYCAQGQYAKAEALYRRALAIWEKSGGSNTIFIAEGLNDLALLYHARGQNVLAEPLYKRALVIYEKELGPDHRLAADVRRNLAENDKTELKALLDEFAPDTASAAKTPQAGKIDLDAFLAGEENAPDPKDKKGFDPFSYAAGAIADTAPTPEQRANADLKIKNVQASAPKRGARLLLPQSSSDADYAREFSDGHRITFNTQNHPKAKGVHFTMAYPSSWVAKEGDRPNIVQKFISDGGHGFEMATISTTALSLPAGTALTEADTKEFFTPTELKGLLPDGATFIDAKPTKIEALPAGILEYSMRRERAGMTIDMQVISYFFIYNGTMVQVAYMVSEIPNSKIDISSRMATFKPLFFSMANSIVISDKWTATPRVPAGSLKSSLYLQDSSSMAIVNLFATFWFNVIIIWVIGLTPIILIRYVFLRRSIHKKTATWVAAGISIFFWIALKISIAIMAMILI